jgi:methylthioribose-1-phosphate isomerase
MKKKIEVSSESGISMPIKNLISIVGAVAVGVWAYFGVVERLNRLESDNRLMHKDLEKAVEFSIKWPRGELGSLPADAEQFLLIEDALKDIEDIQEELKESRHNATNISRLQKDVDRLMNELEKLKDKVRENGSHG